MPKKAYRVAVITLSDKGAQGLREDKSGPLIAVMTKEAGYKVVSQVILPDDQELLAQNLVTICDEGKADLILTTGGTGFSKRDCTPEATLAAGERLVPGIPEAMRYESLKITPRAMLSRGTAVIRKETLIINLPGSEKAVRENLAFILPTLAHGLGILTGHEGECGQP